ncbi:putative reverse transcriptase domain-containing protein [Tanacetum coccineum]
MLNSSTGLFSFQISSMDGLDAMLENGLWFIRNNPLILKKWNLDVNLLKEDVGNVSVWVKLHRVHVTAFTEDGLSAIATKLGRSSYARALIEIRADVELKDNIVVAMPKLVGKVFYICTIRVEYEWKPPSEDEVESVDNEKASFLASKKVGYGTNSLLAQWKETYEDVDYDYDPYDDDMYEGQEVPDKIQSICDNLDIKVLSRKKK